MSLSFLSFLLILFLAVPLWNFEIYRKAWRWESDQIAADNAAIRWGKADREVLRFLQTSNRVIDALEIAHHPLHLCARVPVTMAECVPQDEALEAELSNLHRLAGEAARALWDKGTLAGFSAITAGSSPLRDFQRGNEPPIREKRCALCGGTYHWEVDPDHPAMESWLTLRTPQNIGAKSALQKDGETWNYALQRGPG